MASFARLTFLLAVTVLSFASAILAGSPGSCRSISSWAGWESISSHATTTTTSSTTTSASTTTSSAPAVITGNFCLSAIKEDDPTTQYYVTYGAGEAQVVYLSTVADPSTSFYLNATNALLLSSGLVPSPEGTKSPYILVIYDADFASTDVLTCVPPVHGGVFQCSSMPLAIDHDVPTSPRIPLTVFESNGQNEFGIGAGINGTDYPNLIVTAYEC